MPHHFKHTPTVILFMSNSAVLRGRPKAVRIPGFVTAGSQPRNIASSFVHCTTPCLFITFSKGLQLLVDSGFLISYDWLLWLWIKLISHQIVSLVMGLTSGAAARRQNPILTEQQIHVLKQAGDLWVVPDSPGAQMWDGSFVRWCQGSSAGLKRRSY